jgi:NAD(P)-dependent dehydrogenase (short-subunit alcohol dehydrogenase family)
MADSQRIAVVTGSNRGLGLGLVRELVAREWRVIAGCRRPDDAGDLRMVVPTNDIIELTTTDDASIVAFGHDVVDRTERVDLLVNNAGIGRSGAPSGPSTWPLAALTSVGLGEMYRTNVIGPVLVTQALSPLLGDGSIVLNMSSRLGSISVGYGRDLGYNTSKAALNMATVVMAGELGERGVTCVTVHPGWVRTDMGGPSAPMSTEESTSALAELVDRIGPEHNGRFLTWTGEEHPW